MNRYSPIGEDRLMRIAVVGSGVAGLGAAYVLSRAHDVHVFERDGRAGGPEDESQSLAEYLDAHRYSERFRRHFLVPLTSALWSTAPGRALEFPAAYAIRFFDNHGMLGFGRFKWRTVTGGSKTYVNAIAAKLGAGLRPGAGVRSLRRT